LKIKALPESETLLRIMNKDLSNYVIGDLSKKRIESICIRKYPKIMAENPITIKMWYQTLKKFSE
jgi:hypothetical protein